MFWSVSSGFHIFFFFFSSRRRHTRYWRDWSSDVCSSDLSLRAWYAAEDFSVITGPTIRRCWSGISSRLLPLCLLRRLAALQRRQLHHHGVRPQDLVRGRVRKPHHEHVGDVPPREVDVVRARRAGREHQYFLVRDPQLPEQLGQGLGLRLLVLERVDHEQGLLARPRIQRGF